MTLAEFMISDIVSELPLLRQDLERVRQAEEKGKRMVKYVDIQGYRNYGEMMPFSHFYQFMGKEAAEGHKYPATIIIHTYEEEAKAFKGVLLVRDKTFQSIPLTDAERESLKPYVGGIEQVDLDVLVKGSPFENEIAKFSKAQGVALDAHTAPAGYKQPRN